MKKKAKRLLQDKVVSNASVTLKKSTEQSGNNHLIMLLSITLVVLTLSVYWQIGQHEFISYDDGVYITKNPHVAQGLSLENITWAFTSTHGANWHPITWISHMADVEIFGMQPSGHHLTNVAIHTASALLLFVLFARITGTVWQSIVVATLFAIHPLHVESVAWAAERKDVLSGFFCFLTLLCYAEYTATRKVTLYFLTLGSYILGLMAKPMLVTLPLVMLLLDYWPLDRYRTSDSEKLHDVSSRVMVLVKEKIPFFICALCSSVITIHAQSKGGALRDIDQITVGLRIGNAVTAYVTYLIKTFWPHDLAVFYPISLSIPSWQVIGSFLLVVAISCAAVRRGDRHSYFAMGWFWFLITLVPVIGLVQVGRQSMADRYTYIPLIGLFIVIAWGIPNLLHNLQYRRAILSVLGGGAVLTSALLTYHQLGYWRDSVTLYRHTVDVTTGNAVMHDNLGIEYFTKGDLVAAVREYQAALAINPNYASARCNLGLAYTSQGDLDGAIREYQAALNVNPEDPVTLNNIGQAFYKKGNLDAAIASYQKLLMVAPDDLNAHFNAGTAFFRKGDVIAAIKSFQKVILLNPNDVDAHFNLGGAFSKIGNFDGAIREYQEVLRISPNDSTAKSNLDIALAQKKAMRH